MQLAAPQPVSQQPAAAHGWRPPAPLPDPAQLAYVANALTILALALALLHVGRRR